MKTVEEMRNMITTFCDGINSSGSCKNCLFKDNPYCTEYNIETCPEDKLKKWFTLIFGAFNVDEKTPKTRAEFLKEVEGIICKDRNEQYGEPEDNFKRIAVFWSNYLDREITSADVAVMMVLFKAARVSASPDKADSWVDMAGYALCGAECAVRMK